MSDTFRSLLTSFQNATSTNPSPPSATQQETNKPLKQILSEIHTSQQIRRMTSPKEKKCNEEPNTVIKVHIAICICIVDSLPYESIWKYWTEQTGGEDTTTTPDGIKIHSSAELYIHAKFPEKITGPWLRSKLIGISYKPNWNDYRVIQAMLACASKAFSTEDKTTHVVFCTESCIPITSLGVCARSLVMDEEDKIRMDRSFLYAYGRNDRVCTRFDELQCFDPLTPYLPPNLQYKALPGWITLCKKHISQIIHTLDNLIPENKREEWIRAFRDVWAPEEVFFPTMLSLLGFLPDTVGRSLMHAEWDERSRGKERAHPVVYTQFTNGLIRDIRNGGCCFMRKWKCDISVQHWIRVVLSSEDGGGVIGEESCDYRNRGGYSKGRREGYHYESRRWNDDPRRRRKRGRDEEEDSRRRWRTDSYSDNVKWNRNKY